MGRRAKKHRSVKEGSLIQNIIIDDLRSHNSSIN